MPRVLIKSERRRRKEERPVDMVMEYAFDSDTIIAIIGQTGAGKSTFINTAVGSSVADVGHGLISCTTRIQPVICRHPEDPSRRIVFVDTPGFDNTCEDSFAGDWSILRRVATWLARSYHPDKKLAGVIYLHEISQTRGPKMPAETMTILNKLCGSSTHKNVVLATTKWCGISYGAGKQREKQLGATLWSDMLSRGSQMVQFQGTRESAWAVLNLIMQKDRPETIASMDDTLVVPAQTDLLELSNLLPETEEGKSLRAALDLWAETRDRANARPWNADEKIDTSDELRRKLQDTTTQLRSRLNQLHDLKMPSTPRLLTFFGTR
ncbi:P-loop containing nucleoside triphosphate hydrolase protein [Hygrophoropsis aurantiaca]|uniref:P-loop containing nucleoside triphosphate hydrolase protein n=1 Tax=Hygrophoropsis aurantiaca TaxID=72124 RepID=A0ACB8ANK4_9AGAM|nr:P-loop containing nucleoside triphosphate hydrolase protein [Hygrophoropsis aurantiaca]